MNAIAKNMEVIFIAAALLCGASNFASATTATRPAPTLAPAFADAASLAAPAAAPMQVVIVSAKRPSAK